MARIQIDFDKFKKVTGYDIKAFFQRYSDFQKQYYQSIVSYYNGGVLNQDAFFELNKLINESNVIEPLFRINTGGLDTIDMWELLDLFSEIQVKLLTTKQTGKWMRSSRLNLNNVGVKINKIQGGNQTLEMVADELGYSNIQDDWVNIAVNNQVVEEDYTMEGGQILTVTFQNSLNVDLDNIVDYTVDKRILGKDIKKKITFINNDLETVEETKAIEQSFGIKIKVQKNSIPEYPDYGINNEIIGTNVAAISYPAIFRDLLALFKQDKRWSEVILINIERKDDAVSLKFEAKTILKNTLVTNINI